MTYRTLADFPDYQFRSDGEVVSTQRREARVLSGGTDKDGYRKFILMDRDGKRRHVRRASVICEAWHGPRPCGMTVRHLDGSKTNDAPSNLAWGTQKENIHDKYRHGTIKRGDDHHSSKLTEQQVREILAQPNIPYRTLAERYGVSTGAIYGVRRGLTWGWLCEAR